MEIKVNVAQGNFKCGLAYSTSGIKQTNKTYKQAKNYRRSKKTSLPTWTERSELSHRGWVSSSTTLTC